MENRKFKLTLMGSIAVLALAFSGCGKSREEDARMDPGETVGTQIAISLDTHADRTRILLDLLDLELTMARNSRAARLKFFKSITPAVIRTMLEVETERKAVLEYQATLKKGDEIPEELEAQIQTLSKRYKAKNLTELSERVDFVPIDMLFTQASVESARGQSPAARDCHNLFGVHAANESQRCPGHPILANYPDFAGSIQRYVLLLNSGSAYKAFRQIRAKLRASVGEKGPLDSAVLVQGLLPYSERGEAYVRDIAAQILSDQLDELYRNFMSKSQD